jgi:hypothetical protein
MIWPVSPVPIYISQKNLGQPKTFSLIFCLNMDWGGEMTMAESLKETHYVIRSPNRLNGPMLFVDDKELAELLLSKTNAKFRQDMKLEIHERKETDNRRTSH